MRRANEKPFYLVIDFEANCSNNNTRDHEIIEFPAVLVDAETGSIVAEFRQFVRTVHTGKVSTFIQNLTGITPQQIYGEGIAWFNCLKLFEEWCEHNGVNTDTATVVTCGDWDLKTMLPRQLLLTKTKLSPQLAALFGCWNNVKVTYRDAYNYRRMMGMANMLIDLKLDLIGRHHSGIDDCRNIARICSALQERKGCDLTRPNRLPERPYWYVREDEMPYRRTKH